MCWHRFINWPGLCDDWGGSVEARVCVKCWKHEQKDCHGKWHYYGHLDPDGAWAKSIKDFLVEKKSKGQ